MYVCVHFAQLATSCVARVSSFQQPRRLVAYPAIVNFTTASLDPAAASSGWKSASFAITFTPTMALFFKTPMEYY